MRFRHVHGVAFVFCFTLLNCQETCFEKFSYEAKSATFDSSDVVSESTTAVIFNVRETLALDEILYAINWTDPLVNPPYVDNDIDPNDALGYIEFSLNEADNSGEASVKASMEGLIDFGAAQRIISVKVSWYFEFTTLPGLVCRLIIYHDLIDENTKEPTLEKEEYTVEIREDYPLQLIIPNLQPMAYDYDAASPNNMFSVETDQDCPIGPESSTYTCVDGEHELVNFILTKPLDFDTMDSSTQISCTVTLKDNGSPVLSSSSSVIITVGGFADEDPVFSASFYQGQLMESIEGSNVAMSVPIEANDPDKPSTDVVYAMTDADDTVQGSKYFVIDNQTGVVSVSQDIDNGFLAYGLVNFILSGCDTSTLCATSVLTIHLPALLSNMTSLKFEMMTYSTQTLSPALGEEILRVHAQTSGNQEDVIYSFDESPYTAYFSIDSTSGVITAAMVETPPYPYVLTAIASDGNQTDHATVNIDVLVPLSVPMVNESIVFTSIQENIDSKFLYRVQAVGAVQFCLLAVEPTEITDSFSIDEATGDVYVIRPLDADNVALGNSATLKCAAYATLLESCENMASGIDDQLERNEVLVQVLITDENEFEPKFLDASGSEVETIVYGYPVEESLQKAIGPVAVVKIRDEDISINIPTFSIEDSPGGFAIDSSSGEIFLIGQLTCQDSCTFSVAADDTGFLSKLAVQVKVLDVGQIFTLVLENTDVNEVEGILRSMSAKAGMNINLLYISEVSGGSSSLQLGKSDKWSVHVQVYGTKGANLLNMEDFNSNLENGGIKLQGVSFSDQELFQSSEEIPYEGGFKTATIVLGTLLGVILLTIVGYVIYVQCYKKKSSGDMKKIHTLGQAYGNSGYEDDPNAEPTFKTIFGNNPIEPPRSESFTKDSSSAKLETSSINSEHRDIAPVAPYRDLYPKASKPIDFDEPRATTKAFVTATTTATMVPLKLDVNKSEVGSSSLYHPPKNEYSLYPPKVSTAGGSDSDISSLSSEKKSNLKASVDLDFNDEPKSVAFKVLVDTQEFQPDTNA